MVCYESPTTGCRDDVLVAGLRLSQRKPQPENGAELDSASAASSGITGICNHHTTHATPRSPKSCAPEEAAGQRNFNNV